MLGASTWRIEEITRDRVIVSPAPGVPGAVPFWKGEGVGRPFELGEKIGRASRELIARSDESALEHLRGEYHLDPRAAQNLLTFLREQAAATGVVPSDRAIVVERFRDEIGDWRVCILTPFGGRVHAPWGMALTARLRDSLGLDAQSIWSDDGIALHLPEADAPPSLADLLIGPDEIEELVVGEVGQTALFGARFRENAARALLIPRRRPGQRTPLWQQRLKAQNLLQVARKYGSFPIILETYRECLQDVFDLPALKRILRGLQTRELDLVEVETASASPFASSLLFDYVATYMYEDDTPPAERRAQALSLDRDLLRELLGQEELRELIDPDALAEVERQLRGRSARSRRAARRPPPPRRPARRASTTRRRPRSCSPSGARCASRIAGEERLVAAEDAGRYRDALGVMPPGGLPEAFLEGGPDSLRQLLLRFAQEPRPVHDGRGRRALRRSTSRRCCTTSSAPTCSSAASSGPAAPSASGATPTCSAGSAAPPSPRSGARSSRPSRPRSAASCPPGTGSTGAPPCARRSCPCRVSRCRSRSGRARCCRGAFPATGPRARRALRRRRARLGRRRARPRRRLLPRGRAGARPPAGAPPPESPRRDAIRAALGRGAMFWADLLDETALEAEAALPALWELVWAGEVTNDAWTPLRAGRRYEAPRARAPSAPLLPHARRRDHVDAGPLVADRPSLPGARRTGARSRSSCSSGRGSSPATASAARGSRAATAPSTRS